MALYQFSKIFLQNVAYLKIGLLFSGGCTNESEEEVPYLWSLSARDSWRTPWPCVTLEDRAVTDLREDTTCHLGGPSTSSLPSYLSGHRIILSRLTSTSFFSFVTFQPWDTGLAVATKVLMSIKIR